MTLYTLTIRPLGLTKGNAIVKQVRTKLGATWAMLQIMKAIAVTYDKHGVTDHHVEDDTIIIMFRVRGAVQSVPIIGITIDDTPQMPDQEFQT
jgi:hypothetical protein